MPFLQIPPESIDKLLGGFVVFASSLRKSESLQEILFESFVTRYIIKYRARQLYKNISMLFLFPVKDGKLSTGVTLLGLAYYKLTQASNSMLVALRADPAAHASWLALRVSHSHTVCKQAV